MVRDEATVNYPPSSTERFTFFQLTMLVFTPHTFILAVACLSSGYTPE